MRPICRAAQTVDGLVWPLVFCAETERARSELLQTIPRESERVVDLYKY